MQFSGFIEASGNATTTEEVFQLLCNTVSPLGCDKIAFFGLTAEAQRALAPAGGEITPLIASNYPEDYLSRYVQKRQYEIDPVLIVARESLVPLVFEDVIDAINLSLEQKSLAIERVEAGIYGEVTCPIHGPRGQTFVLCFARDRPGEHDRASLSALQVLAIHFYYGYARVYQTRIEPANAPTGLADGPPMALTAGRALTQRERECLLWTARGKSASTISVILGLSENTINFYVKNAMRKFGTTNRVVAVVLAVRAGLIQP